MYPDVYITPPHVPFGRNEDGDLVPLEPMEAQSGEAARRKAHAATDKHGGAIAFSRTGGTMRKCVVPATA